MNGPRIASFLVCQLALFLLGCSDDSSESSAAGESASAPEEARSEGVAPLAQGQERLRYDLVQYFDRAEHWAGDVRVIDFGAPGDAQYTLGGWRTRVGDAGTAEDVTYRTIRGTHGRILVPSTSAGAQSLLIRLATRGGTDLTIYLDEETVGHRSLPRDGSFSTIRVDLPEEDFAPGEHFIKLRVPRSGPGDRTLRVDWVRVGPRQEEDSPLPDSTSERASRSDNGIRIPDGASVSFFLELWEETRLRGEVSGAGTLIATTETATEIRGHSSITSDSRADWALAGDSGEVVRVRLTASGGEVRLERPRLITLDGAESRELQKPTNVLIYLIDTLRKDRLTAYNPETRVRSPGFDRFAREAALFERGQAQENWTKPSVATLLSGLFPWEHGATEGEAALPGSVELLSETLGERGFYTGAFIANGYVSTPFGFRQGWSTFRNYIKSGRRTQARFVAADVLDWLDERPEEEPFFLYVHTIDPHVPYMPPDSILEEYDPEPYHGPINFAEDREILEKIKSGALRPNARDRQRLEALYDGEITYHDQHFHSIMEGLSRRGLADSTMVVVTADHGEEFFDHDSVGHGHSVWQELLNVPLAIRIPGNETVRLTEAVGLVDVVPTIFELLELPRGNATGRSLVPLLRGDSEAAPSVSVSGFMNGWRTIVVGRWKMIQRTENRILLFDLTADPGEETDVTDEHPMVVRYLRGLLGLALSGDGPQIAHQGRSVPIEGELREQLQAIGYVDPESPNQPAMAE